MAKKNELSGTGEKISESDYYKLGTAAITAIGTADSIGKLNNDTTLALKAYAIADSVGKAYIAAYPDKPQGYSLRVAAAKKADADTSKGYAVEPIQQYNAFLIKDTAVNSKKIAYFNDYYLLALYTHAPSVDGYKKAIDVCEQMIQLYPNPPGGEEYDFAFKTKNAVAKSF